MSLRIARLSTRCLAPRGQEHVAALVDEAARTTLPRALAARLGPSLDSEAAVCRVKALDVSVRIDTRTLQRGGLADAWADALAHALHAALARPDGEGTGLRRHESRASYLAAMIGHVLSGRAGGDWAFPELAARGSRPPSILVLDILLDAGVLLPEVLAALRRGRLLEATLALPDEVGLERLLRAATEAHGDSTTPGAEQVIAIATALAAQRTAPLSGQAASRRQALVLWLELDRILPARALWQTLRLLLRFLHEPALLQPGAETAALADLPAWCEEVRRSLVRHMPPAAARALGQLRALTPGAPAADGARERWLGSDCAGVLLLCDIIRRLGWPGHLREAGHDRRTVQALLAGAGMRLLQPRWQPGEPVEPAVSLLAGMIEEVDRLGLARILEGIPPQLPRLDARDWASDGARDWPGLLEQAADALVGAFAARIRGFRSAGRESVVRHFLRVPGRVLIDDISLRVVLEPSPWSVALHISGADDPLEDLDWLGGRRVSFVLEGL